MYGHWVVALGELLLVRKTAFCKVSFSRDQCEATKALPCHMAQESSGKPSSRGPSFLGPEWKSISWSNLFSSLFTAVEKSPPNKAPVGCALPQQPLPGELHLKQSPNQSNSFYKRVDLPKGKERVRNELSPG